MSRAVNKEGGEAPTIETAQAIGRDLHGIKFIVIDEVSMISCLDLEIMEQRIKSGILTTIVDEEERMQREAKPFAGVHVLFAGDFYQLPPVSGQPLFIRVPKGKKLKGRCLWKLVSKFVRLTKNFRLMNNSEGTRALAECLTQLRVGHVTDRALAILNSRVCVSEKAVEIKTADKGCLWLAPTRDMVKARNKLCLISLKKKNQHMRFFAKHLAPSLHANRDQTTEKFLRAKDDPTHLRSVLDLSIGSRVRVVRNRAAVLGALLADMKQV